MKRLRQFIRDDLPWLIVLGMLLGILALQTAEGMLWLPPLVADALSILVVVASHILIAVCSLADEADDKK